MSEASLAIRDRGRALLGWGGVGFLDVLCHVRSSTFIPYPGISKSSISDDGIWEMIAIKGFPSHRQCNKCALFSKSRKTSIGHMLYTVAMHKDALLLFPFHASSACRDNLKPS